MNPPFNPTEFWIQGDPRYYGPETHFSAHYGLSGALPPRVGDHVHFDFKRPYSLRARVSQVLWHYCQADETDPVCIVILVPPRLLARWAAWWYWLPTRLSRLSGSGDVSLSQIIKQWTLEQSYDYQGHYPHL